MTIEITMRTGLVCPICGREMTFTTGLLGAMTSALFSPAFLARIKREGATITSGVCGHRWEVKPE